VTNYQKGRKFEILNIFTHFRCFLHINIQIIKAGAGGQGPQWAVEPAEEEVWNLIYQYKGRIEIEVVSRIKC
jgi:hypothetical protein